MPPTDNLFKFLTISGIIIYLFSINLAVNQFVQKREDKFELKKDSINIQKDIHLEKLSKKFILSQYRNKTGANKDSVSNILNGQNQLSTFIANSDGLMLYKEYQTLSINIDSNLSKLAVVSDKIKEANFYISRSARISTLIYILAAIMIAMGFYNWYVKIHLRELKRLNENTEFSFDNRSYDLDEAHSTIQKIILKLKNYFNQEHRIQLIFIALGILLIIAPFFILAWLTK